MTFFHCNNRDQNSLYRPACLLLLCLCLYACGDDSDKPTSMLEKQSAVSGDNSSTETAPQGQNLAQIDPATKSAPKNGIDTGNQEYDYPLILNKIAYGQASFSEIRISLSQDDVAGLTNTVHALYSMRWQRQVHHLLYDMWNGKASLYPELAWDKISKPPVRIALASTIFRIQSLDPLKHYDSHQYKNYIRQHQYDEHEFNRAQVVIGLGLAGDPVDVPYLLEMASGNNQYVTQSAITGLALMNNKQASNGLIALYKQYQNDDMARAELILDVLEKAYNLKPTTTSPKEG